jgi:hypothetical protein
MMTGQEYYSTFCKNLWLSGIPCHVARVHFACLGIKSEVPETIVTPDYESRLDYGDDGDLHITSGSMAGEVISVKGSTYNFGDSPSGWPHPVYFIHNAPSLAKAEKKPLWFINIDASLTCAGRVPLADKDRLWSIQDVPRKRDGFAEPTWVTDQQNVEFFRLQAGAESSREMVDLREYMEEMERAYGLPEQWKRWGEAIFS